MMRPAFIGLALWVCALLSPLPAAADPVDVHAGVTLDFLDGKHESGGGSARLTFVPLPLVDADVRYERTAIHVEGLPSVTFGYGSDSLEGASATRLSILNTSLRQYVTPSLFLGVGQTVYNQRTYYDLTAQTTPLRTLSQESRVTGLRFEAGLDRTFSPSTRARLVIAVNPVMHGLQYSTIAIAGRSCSVINGSALPACPTSELTDPERSAQADVSISFTRRMRAGELVYGLRYLDYVARYSEAGTAADGALADRNVGFMPLLGFRVKL